MAAHAAVPARRARRVSRETPARHHTTHKWVLPLILGVSYGFYTAFMERHGGPANFGQLAMGLISGAAVFLLSFTVGRLQHVLPPELSAAAYGAVTGGAFGFLYSLTGESVLRSSGIGFGIGAGMLIASFYMLYTRQDRARERHGGRPGGRPA